MRGHHSLWALAGGKVHAKTVHCDLVCGTVRRARRRGVAAAPVMHRCDRKLHWRARVPCPQLVGIDTVPVRSLATLEQVVDGCHRRTGGLIGYSRTLFIACIAGRTAVAVMRVALALCNWPYAQRRPVNLDVPATFGVPLHP